MNKIFQAAAELQSVCQSQGWQFCFIGVALQRWSEPRETVDVDLSLLAGFGQEQQFSNILLQHFEPRISNAADFARERVIVRQMGKLDWDYIYEQLRPLAQLKDAPEIVDQLEARRVEFER